MLARPSPLEHDPAQAGLFEVEVSRTAPARILEIPEQPEVAEPVEKDPHYVVVDIRDAAPFVLQSLSHLAQASMREGYRKVAHTEDASSVMARHNKQHKSFVGYQEGARFNQKQYFKKARTEFHKAYNLGLESPVAVEDPEFALAFNAFAGRYGVGGSPEQTQRKRMARDKAVKSIGHLQQEFTGLPPAVAGVETFPPSEDAKLRVRHTESPITKNLELLHDDPRANFWPASYQEGTAARQILRLNTEHSGAFQNYLADLGRSAGSKVAEAKIYEYADFMDNGKQSWETLAALDARLREFTGSPNTHLMTIARDARAAQALLARFLDIESRATNPAHGQQFDPQRNKRTDFMDLGSGRHKQLHGIYDSNSPDDVAFVDSRIAELLGTMNIAQAQAVVDRALANESARVKFWITTLESLKGPLGRIAHAQLER